MRNQTTLTEGTETSRLGIPHLQTYWARVLAQRKGKTSNATEQTWQADNLLLNGLGLPLQETLRHLLQTGPSLAEFEDWILARNGGWLTDLQTGRLRSAFAGQPYDAAVTAQLRAIANSPDVLSADDLQHWDQYDYVVLR